MTTEIELPHVKQILSPWRTLIGVDYAGYRNHVTRMAIFCLSLRECSEDEKRKIVIAACFHDIGIWIENTVDYIEPSIPPALDYLKSNNLMHWSEEIALMIREHHKITRYETDTYPLVEVFRRGDLVDFSWGMFKFGLSADFIGSVKRQYPNAGFHKTLARRGWAWFIRHPLKPAPMMKW